jgi:hypothetical protein
LEATVMTRPRSVKYVSGVLRRFPVRAPVWVSSTSGSTSDIDT